MPRISPDVDLERDVADVRALRDGGNAAHLQSSGTAPDGGCRSLEVGASRSRPTIALDKLLGRSFARRRAIDDAAAAHDHDAIGAGGDVGELVGDQHHRLAFRGQRDG